MTSDLKNPKVWIHYGVIAGAVIVVSPIISNILDSIFKLGTSWTNFVSIALVLITADVVSEKWLKI